MVIAAAGNDRGGVDSPQLDMIITRFDQDGRPDTTFGANGRVRIGPGVGGADIDVTGLNGEFCLGAIQPDGKLVLSGSTYRESGVGYQIKVLRLHPNGQLDGSFGQNGLYEFDHGAVGLNEVGSGSVGIAIDAINRVLIAGQGVSSSGNYWANRVGLALRLTAHGAIDSSFGNSNGVLLWNNDPDVYQGNHEGFSSVTVQPDGKILLGGEDNYGGDLEDAVIVRLTSNGALDLSFGNDGVRELPLKYDADPSQPVLGYKRIELLNVDSQGGIVAAGTRNFGGASGLIYRLNTLGNLDPTFVNGWIVPHNLPASISVDASGIRLVGQTWISYYDDYIAVGKLKPDGTADNSFNTADTTNPSTSSQRTWSMILENYLCGEQPRGAVFQDNGKIVVGGAFTCGSPPVPYRGIYLVRFNPDGSVDETFGNAAPPPPPEETVAVIMVHGFMGNPGSFSDDDKLYRDCPAQPPSRQEDPKNYDRECWKQNGPGNVIRLDEAVCQRDSYLRPECQPKMGRLLQKDAEVQGANLIIAKPFDYSDKTSPDKMPSGGDWTIQQLAGELAKHIKCVTDLDPRCVDPYKYRDLQKVDRVDIVAHSMGGLVARAYIAGIAEDRTAKANNTEDCNRGKQKCVRYKDEIRKLVTVGTPHYGSLWGSSTVTAYSDPVSNFAKKFVKRHPEQVKQLDLGSGLLWELHERWKLLESHIKPDLLAVAGTSDEGSVYESDWDGVVNVSSAVLPDLDNDHIRYVPYRHYSVLSGLYPLPALGKTLVGVDAANHQTYVLARDFLLGEELPVTYSIENKPFTDHGYLLLRLSDEETKMPLVPLSQGVQWNNQAIPDFTCGKISPIWDPTKCYGAYRNIDAGTVTLLPIEAGNYHIEINSPTFYEKSNDFLDLSDVQIDANQTNVISPLYFTSMPDLVITGFSAPKCVSSLQKISVSVIVQNNGKKDAQASALKVAVGQTDLQTIQVGSVKSGAKKTIRGSISIPLNVYKAPLRFVVDSNDNVREWNEENNTTTTVCLY